MPLVEVSEVIAAPAERVWDVVKDVSAYPRLMEHVRFANVVESGPRHRLLEMEVVLKGCIMRWIEREEIDAARRRIDYRMIEGDLATFEGFWQIDPVTADSSRMTVSVLFDI